MLRRSSHWPAKLAVKRWLLGSFSRRSTCARKTSGLCNHPLAASSINSRSGVDDQRKYESLAATA